MPLIGKSRTLLRKALTPACGRPGTDMLHNRPLSTPQSVRLAKRATVQAAPVAILCICCLPRGWPIVRHTATVSSWRVRGDTGNDSLRCCKSCDAVFAVGLVDSRLVHTAAAVCGGLREHAAWSVAFVDDGP